MKPFKTKQEIAELKREFVDGVGKSDVWSVSGLNQLSNEDLIKRLVQIDNQSTLMKWRILWILRQRYDSDTLFGQYIAELRSDPAQTLCLGNQMDIYRAWNAGKFCETYDINDLSEISISQTAIYELSRPANEAVSGDVFNAIRYKKVPVSDVKRMLEQAKAVSTIETQELILEVDKIDTSLTDIEPELVEVINYHTENRRMELIQELCNMDSKNINKKQALKEICDISKSYTHFVPIKMIIKELEKLLP